VSLVLRPEKVLPERIAVDYLHKVIAALPAEMRADDGGRTIGLANTVIVHFLGREWLEANIKPDIKRPGFLRLDFSSDVRREASVFRVVELAESLYNLQHIPGFDDCIEQIRAGGDKIQSACAELDFARFLYIHEVDFHFVVRKMRKGEDYDFELTYPDGLKVPADAKCKFETTKIDPAGIHKSLKKAKGQLPKDRPGIIFIKVPQSWISDLEVAKEMVNVGKDFLKTTGRIISVKFYVSQLQTVNKMVMHRHALREITNSDSRFHDGRNWDLFTDYPVPSSWNGMPPKWQRLFFFPNSRQGEGRAANI